jgi:ssDNA-binding Zn-finger/Zn-ribbon topoisomerase 1
VGSRASAASSQTKLRLVNSESGKAQNISLPKCGKAMALRTAHKGDRAGSQFWGCVTYPACKGTREVTEQHSTNWGDRSDKSDKTHN